MIRTTPSRLILRHKHLALVLIVALAAFLRLYRIDSLPPGDGYDPAWYGVDALQILDGKLPIYLPTNIGREAMFSYLVAACVAIFGIGPHAIHIASAVVGILTVPATYLAAEALFAREKGLLHDWGGLVSALMVTVSFWHLHWSRYGVRAILVPLFTALTLWMLVRAVRLRRRGAFVITGVLLGLSFYTYQSARTLPALVLGAFAALTWSEHGTLKRALSREALVQLLLLTGAAVIVFAPMGAYLVAQPGIGDERIDQIWVLDPALSLGDNAVRVKNEIVDALKVIAIEGDEEPIHNLPGRPAMNAFLVALLGLGLIAALARIRRPTFAILLIWIPVMSVTAILTLGGQPTKRALGALPAIAMLVAAGALMPLDVLRNRGIGRPAWRVTAALWGLVLVAGFGYSALATYRDYFLVWGRDPNLFTHFEAGRDAIGQYAGSLPPGEAIYSSPEMPDHPGIVYNSGARPGLKGYNGRVCFVYPETTQQPTTYIIVQHQESQSLDVLARIYPEGESLGAGPAFYGQPFFTAYRVPEGTAALLTPTHSAPATWEGAVRLLGYDISAEEAQPGESLQLSLYYGALAPIDRNWIVFVHLLGPDNPATGNTLWAQDDSEPCRAFYPTSNWSVGEIVRDTFTLSVPENAPPGQYTLQMGFYTWPDIQRLTTESGPDGTPQIALPFGKLTVTAE